MFEETRLSYGLTRSHLSVLTGRSVGYLLKAEQATFPCPPVALLAFYTADQPPLSDTAQAVLGPALSGFLVQNWVSHNKEDLISAYRDKQRRIRETWLDRYYPVSIPTSNRPFRLKWYNGYEEDGQVPNQYQVSCGLCLPAAVLYRNEKDRRPSIAIRRAMEDLVEYIKDGRFRSKYYSDESLPAVETAVMRIAKEEGVDLSE